MHTFRHPFAKHLFSGTLTTEPVEVYTHLSTKALSKIRSPLDDLDLE